MTEQVDSLFKGKTKTSQNIYSSISKLDILDNIRINEDALATVTAKLTSRKSNTNNVKPDQLDSSSSSGVQHSTNVQVQLQPKSIDKVPNVKNFETSSQSKVLNPEKKYLELIDLLTENMFDNYPKPERHKLPPEVPKKSSSLPRTLDVRLQHSLQKSSSQTFNPESPLSGNLYTKGGKNQIDSYCRT